MKTKFFIFLLLVLLVSCKKSESELPVLRDVTIGKVLHNHNHYYDTYLILSSEVIAEGASEVYEQGFCYSKSPNPTIDDNVSMGYDTKGSFTYLADIWPSVHKYYIRAYAKNSNGIGYGREVEFTWKQYEDPKVPGFTAPTIDSVKNNIVYVSAKVTVNGNPRMVARGVCFWDRNGYEFIKAEGKGKGTGKYTCVLPDLKKDTYIYSYAETEFEIYIGGGVKYE